DHAGRASIFTGVKSGKTNVGGSYVDNKFKRYPSFFSLIGEESLKAVQINDISSLNDTLLRTKNSVSTIKTNTDKEVKDSALNRLKTGDMDLMVVSFRSVNDAGKNHGFSSSSNEYVEALEKIDSYV